MGKKVEHIGVKFNRLRALEHIKNDKYKYVCDCGNITIKRRSDVVSEKTKSCGCYQKDVLTKRNKNNSKYNALSEKSKKLYGTWSKMIDRCNNPNNNVYKYYGGRGIKVCDEWQESFEKFVEDMGDKPHPSYSLDRIDNNLGYCVENCKWSSHSEQMINRRYEPNKLNEKFITKRSDSYRVDIKRNGVRRQRTVSTIEEAIKIRDLWLEEYEQDKNEWVINTQNRRY